MVVLHVKVVGLVPVTCEVHNSWGAWDTECQRRERHATGGLRTSERPQLTCSRARRGREQEAHEEGRAR